MNDDAEKSESGRYGMGERATSAYVAGPHVQPSVDLTDFVSFLRALWRGRWYIAVFAGVALLLSVAALFAFRTLGPITTTYNTALVLTMPGAEPGKYPNGTSFSPSDLRSPNVLSRVYEQNSLRNWNMSLEEFVDSVGVTLYALGMDSISGRYRDRLADRNLTFEEKKSIEEEYRQQIAGLINTGVLVTLDVPDQFGIPAQVARKVVNDIPAAWADIFINQLGAFSNFKDRSGATLVDGSFAASLDYPVYLDYIESQVDILESHLDSIAALPNGSTTLSSKSGKTIGDLSRDLGALKEFRIRRTLQPLVDLGPSKTPEITIISYRNQFNHLDIDAQTARERSSAVTSVVGEAETTLAPSAPAPVPDSPLASSIAQFDGSFVDKIIDLSLKGSGREFKEGLLGKKLEIEDNGISVQEKKERLSRRIASIEAFVTDPAKVVGKAEVFVDTSKEVDAGLNAIWEDSNQIVTQVDPLQLNFDKVLYKPAALESDVQISRPGMLRTRNLAFVGIMTVLGAAIGFAVFLLRQPRTSISIG